MSVTFEQYGIHPTMVARLKQLGISSPTLVQQRAIPAVLRGCDVTVQAQTGTGKTLAFLLPLLEQHDPAVPHIQALILTPTRELAIQIAAEADKLVQQTDLSVLAVYGGQDVIAQIHKLQGQPPAVVIATPGRLCDHLRRGTIDLTHLRSFVLDEADQVLHMGFLPEVEDIIGQMAAERQTLLYSATFPDHVRRLARDYTRDPVDIRVEGKRVTLDEIKQYVVETTDRAKRDTLLQLLREEKPMLAVMFCRTKIRAKKLAEVLASHYFQVGELHGDLTQARREEVMRQFRSGEVQLLVATDVAARGLDVDGVTHVFNYDIPHDTESYIHRIGRTGRAGHTGVAITLAAAKDAAFLEEIEEAIGAKLKRKTVVLHERTEQAHTDSRASVSQTGRNRDVQQHHTQRADGRSSGRTTGRPANGRPGPAGRQQQPETAWWREDRGGRRRGTTEKPGRPTKRT